MLKSFRGLRKSYDNRSHSPKRFLTTKHTKDTKVSDIDISKLLNFVLFVTFVVICLFLLWLRPCRAWLFVVSKFRGFDK